MGAAAASSRLPVFPLDMVAFPGQQCPLYLFEPRYQVMLHRVLHPDSPSHRCFAICPPLEDPLQPRQPEAVVGTVVEVTHRHWNDDGSASIVTWGAARFRAPSSALSLTPYGFHELREPAALLQDEEPGSPTVLQPLAEVGEHNPVPQGEGTGAAEEEVEALVERLEEGLLLHTPREARPATLRKITSERSRGPSVFSLWLSGAMEMTVEEKQGMLEMTVAADRLAALLEMLDAQASTHPPE